MNRFAKFLDQRLGIDGFGRFLLFVWLVLALFNLIFHSVFLGVLCLIVALFYLFRFFSRNLVLRRRENAWYYEKKTALKKRIQKFNVRIRDRKKYHFFKCPACRADIRMPRKIGTFEIRCRRCGNSFTKSFRK